MGNPENNKSKKIVLSIKDKVMERIRNKRIEMRSPLVFAAEKLGLESALVTAILASALLVSVTFYFLKKTGVLKFFNLGIPGLKVILLTLPYDYLALFIIAIILAVYLANKLKLSCGECTHTNAFIWSFFLGALILGIFFGVMGVGNFLKGWSKNGIPRDSAIQGRIRSFSGKSIIVEDKDDEAGNVITVFMEEMNDAGQEINLVEGKILRATGFRDKDNHNFFHAQKIHCCDED